ncbi:hypothetical protein ACFC18_24215 [Streptomyces sp. NPDC056121]|uniref:hypothetical protein n=1 Tax=unclassified Streptomyces TaxID=2593676 RepID=UPI00225A00B5|nr:hypothetical protein [Streptomyces sp. NBC_00401]MCX5081691.1 hypothetical protein [Streptomyces sp. NBC_00401]
MWYAHNPGRRARQLLGDGAALLWTALWAAVALAMHRLVQPASPPAPHRPRIPLLGSSVDGALRGVAHAGDRIVSAAPAPQGPAAAQALAVLGTAALFLIPVGLMLTVWLPRRIRWTRQAAAAQELAGTEDGRELLALRALLRPLDELAATAELLPAAPHETSDQDLDADLDPDPDPDSDLELDVPPGPGPGSLAKGWREADPVVLDALADAELQRLGLRT